MSLKVPIKQQPFDQQAYFSSSFRQHFLQGGGGVNIYVLSEGVRPVENKWKGVDLKLYLGLNKNQVMKQMQAREHSQLWLGLCRLVQISKMISGFFSFSQYRFLLKYLFSDKFDQFWAVNRRLMEGSDSWRHLPVR